MSEITVSAVHLSTLRRMDLGAVEDAMQHIRELTEKLLTGA